MAYNSNITVSLHGRQVGLQRMSSAQTGGSHGFTEVMAGPEDLRKQVTTAAATGTNVKAYGVTKLPGTSVGSSSVYTLDPPIPGVTAIIQGSTRATTYLKSGAATRYFQSSWGSSFTTIKCSSVGGTCMLVGLTTAIWLGLNLTSGTSAKAGTFTLTTTT